MEDEVIQHIRHDTTHDKGKGKGQDRTDEWEGKNKDEGRGRITRW